VSCLLTQNKRSEKCHCLWLKEQRTDKPYPLRLIVGTLINEQRQNNENVFKEAAQSFANQEPEN
jgi:hypothetical protein